MAPRPVSVSPPLISHPDTTASVGARPLQVSGHQCKRAGQGRPGQRKLGSGAVAVGRAEPRPAWCLMGLEGFATGGRGPHNTISSLPSCVCLSCSSSPVSDLDMDSGDCVV